MAARILFLFLAAGQGSSRVLAWGAQADRWVKAGFMRGFLGMCMGVGAGLWKTMGVRGEARGVAGIKNKMAQKNGARNFQIFARTKRCREQPLPPPRGVGKPALKRPGWAGRGRRAQSPWEAAACHPSRPPRTSGEKEEPPEGWGL